MLAIQFAVAAYFKLTMFSGQVAETAAVGVPFASLAVALALLLEIVAVASLITGWQLRAVAFVLAPYIMLLAVIFYHNWSDMQMFGMFVSHLGLTAALLYVSVFGTSFMSIEKK
jgi:putative oxidoreductase